MVCSNFNVLCVSDCKNLAKFISETTRDCSYCILEKYCHLGGTCYSNWLDAFTKEDSDMYKALQRYINSDIINTDITNAGTPVPFEW